MAVFPVDPDGDRVDAVKIAEGIQGAPVDQGVADQLSGDTLVNVRCVRIIRNGFQHHFTQNDIAGTGVRENVGRWRRAADADIGRGSAGARCREAAEEDTACDIAVDHHR